MCEKGQNGHGSCCNRIINGQKWFIWMKSMAVHIHA
uniref:Uncharacterized protein n=1 Tax=Manihot esculenta TaxID=3983 RepID=A0A2C9WGS3_MANES